MLVSKVMMFLDFLFFVQTHSKSLIKAFTEPNSHHFLNLIMRNQLDKLFQLNFSSCTVANQRLTGHVLDRLIIEQPLIQHFLSEKHPKSQHQIAVIDPEILVPIVNSKQELPFLLNVGVYVKHCQ